MSIKSWNRCFLCSVPLTTGEHGPKPTSSAQQNSSCQRILFRYLLNEFQGSSALYQDILSFNNASKEALSTNGGSSPSIHFCNFCNQLSQNVSDLHTQLEVIQMKIIEKVNAAKQVVINNSRLYGTNQKVKDDLEAFEEHLDYQGKVEFGQEAVADVERNRKFLEMFYLFQTQVFEKGFSSQQYPFVYLQRYTGSNAISSSDTNSSSPHFGSGSILIKKEPSDLEPDATGEPCPTSDDDNLLEFDYGGALAGSDNDPDWEGGVIKGEDEDSSPETLSSSKRKVRKRKIPHSEKNRPSRSSKRLKKIETVKKEVKLVAEQVSINDNESKVIPYQEPLSEAQRIGAEMRLERKRAAAAKLKKTLKTLVRVKDEKRQRGKRRKRPRRKKHECEEEECSFQCYRTFTMEQHLREHETSEKNFKCPGPDCNKEFTKKQYLDFHIYTYCGSPPLKCDACHQTIMWGKLKEHYDTEHEGKVYTCKFCDSYFGTYQTFLNHTLFHPGQAFKCFICPAAEDDAPKLYKRTDLFRHLHKAHNNTDNALVCDFPGCSRIYYNGSALLTHKQTHDPITPTCNICGKTYALKHEVEAHISFAHKRDGPYKCEVCSEIFLHDTTLMSHKRQKHGLKKLKCEQCPDKEYSTSRGLTVHMQVAHGVGIKQMFTCTTCGKQVLSAAQLRRHQAVHLEEKQFICDLCGFATKSIERLKKHQLVHTGPKRHGCPHCAKIFRLPAHLKEHIRTHTLEKPYVCDECGQCFSQSGSLILHRKKKHLDMPTCHNNSAVIPTATNPFAQHSSDSTTVSTV